MSELPEDAARLLALFDQLGIAHATFHHPAVFTVEEAAAVERDIPATHTKNLFLYDSGRGTSDDGPHYLYSLAAARRADLKALQKALDCKRLSFGRPEPMQRLLGVTPGSVTAYAVMNDTARQVNMVLDGWLLKQDKVGFHPLINTATTVIRGADLLPFIRAVHGEPRVLDLPAPERPDAA